MSRTKNWMAGGALAAFVVLAASGMAVANGGTRDSDTPLTGTALEKAEAAALAHTGGGTVIESEIGDGSAAYGIEIRLDDGSTVEVNLDAEFKVIGSEPDEDSTNGTGD